MKITRLIGILLFSVAGLAWTGSVLAQAGEPAITLEQAVSQVQHETGGKVLSASTVRRGRGSFEHRIKVLTPSGHVRVMTVTTEGAKGPASADSTKNSTGDGEGNKEKD
jgi:hypothetical protein